MNLKCEGKTNYLGLLYTLRILTGLAESCSFPALYTLYEKWVPKNENTTIMSLCGAGSTLGTIIAFFFSGYWIKVKTPIIGGWTGVNYIVGFIGIIWFIFWEYLVS